MTRPTLPLLAATLLAAMLLSGCVAGSTGNGAATAASSAAKGKCPGIYTFGDAAYIINPTMGEAIYRPGRIPADEVPPQVPRAYLEPDGSFAGAPVYCTAEDTRKSIAALIKENKLPEGDWRVYQLEGDWATGTYELKSGEYRLARDAAVIDQVADTSKK